MALLFDEAQGAFQDTGSKTSPTKKQTGLMRKQMNKMDEAAPRCLLYTSDAADE